MKPHMLATIGPSCTSFPRCKAMPLGSLKQACQYRTTDKAIISPPQKVISCPVTSIDNGCQEHEQNGYEAGSKTDLRT